MTSPLQACVCVYVSAWLCGVSQVFTVCGRTHVDSRRGAIGKTVAKRNIWRTIRNTWRRDLADRPAYKFSQVRVAVHLLYKQQNVDYFWEFVPLPGPWYPITLLMRVSNAANSCSRCADIEGTGSVRVFGVTL